MRDCEWKDENPLHFCHSMASRRVISEQEIPTMVIGLFPRKDRQSLHSCGRMHKFFIGLAHAQGLADAKPETYNVGIVQPSEPKSSTPIERA